MKALWIVTWVLMIAGIGMNSAEARWATPEDAASEIEFSNSNFEVNSDGTYTETQETQSRVLKESGRAALAVFRMSYNSNLDALEVMEAKTINAGREIPVPSKTIEDKQLASSGHGFDQLRQLFVAFPEVNIGSRVYIKYRMKSRQAGISKFFSKDFLYGLGSPENSGVVTIASKLPLSIQKIDPTGVLKLTQENRDGEWHARIELTRPVFRRAVEEASETIMDPKQYPWVAVSTAKSWPEMSRELLPRYEKVLTSPLPGAFESIASTAAVQKTVEGRTNVITSMLAERINYLGDWKTVSGRFIPRDLSTIAETHFGDCKDFAASTVAILRRLGYAADVALVHRGMPYRDRPFPVSQPSMSDFNHAIVYLKANGKDYWIDPTNFVSFAHGIFPDIEDRPALILNHDNPVMARTTALKPEDTTERMVYRVELDDSGNRSVHGEVEPRGVAAISTTGAQLRSSEKTISYSFLSRFADKNRVLDWKLEPFDLTSRVVRNQKFAFSFREKKSLMKTSAGPAYPVIGVKQMIEPFLSKTENMVSDLHLGVPVAVEREIRLVNVRAVGQKPLNCSIQTDFFDVHREITENSSGIRIRDRLRILSKIVPNEKLKTPEYAKIQERLNDCFHNVAIVYEPKKPGSKPNLVHRTLASRQNHGK